jgi:hypothetical protein
MTMIGMPATPVPVQRAAGPVVFTEGHHFAASGSASIDDLAEAATVPLSVILQVTKRCNFDCSFCSETLQLPDPSLAQLDAIRANLAGTQRVFLSGGEPLLRRDFGDIVDSTQGTSSSASPRTRRAGSSMRRRWWARSRSSTSAWRVPDRPPTGSAATTTR